MNRPVKTDELQANNLAHELMQQSDAGRPLVIHARVVCGPGGGPEKTILNSPRFLQAFGFDSICVYLRDPADKGFESIELRARSASAPLISVDDLGALDYRIPGHLNTLLDELSDRTIIWHGHDYKSNLLGLLLRRKSPMSVVTTVHGWVHKTWKTPLYYWVDRWCLKRCDEVVCVSNDLFERCIRMGVDPHHTHQINNAIALDDYRRKETINTAKSQLGFSTDRKLIGAVGRLAHEKGFDSLINAVARLIHDGTDANLVIIGSGPEQSALQHQIDSLKLDDNIKLLGHVVDPRPYFEAMDVFALSSRREGLPNVVLEAMALSVPVVATEIAGIPNLISDGQNGLLVKPDHPRELSRELHRLLTDQDLANKAIDGGLSTIRDHFCFQQRIAKIAQIYNNMMTRHLR